ncbi:MAG: amidohydrolase [Firmicutes bacterium]|jgi:predicted TIM-barrel fold metal-dependent hydrolase|nr:amidohydrolase [Bacillota bacterium]
MRIIDGHAHVSETDYGSLDIYLSQIAQCGIQAGVIVPGGMMDVRRMTDYITGRAQPENPVPNNTYVARCMDTHKDMLWGLVCVDPHSSEAVQVLEQSLQHGFRGLKLNPMTHQFSFASKAIADLASLCGDHGVPVYTHVVYSPGASTSKFVSLAKNFPKTNFILGHMGFGPADQEGLEAAARLDNFFLETSTGSFLHIKEAVHRAGATKVLFGSEFPLSHPKVELEKILLLDIPASEKEQILGGNIMELLGLN